MQEEHPAEEIDGQGEVDSDCTVSTDRSQNGSKVNQDLDIPAHGSKATKVMTKGDKSTNIVFEENNNFVDMVVAGSLSEASFSGESESSMSSDDIDQASESKSGSMSSDGEIKFSSNTASGGVTDSESYQSPSPKKR